MSVLMRVGGLARTGSCCCLIYMSAEVNYATGMEIQSSDESLKRITITLQGI